MTMESNKITEIIIGAAIAVHRALGPGLLESTYEACMLYELNERGLKTERQKALPVTYRGVHLECGYRIDLLVEDLVIVELKAVEKLEPIHERDGYGLGQCWADFVSFNSTQMHSGGEISRQRPLSWPRQIQS